MLEPSVARAVLPCLDDFLVTAYTLAHSLDEGMKDLVLTEMKLLSLTPHTPKRDSKPDDRPKTIALHCLARHMRSLAAPLRFSGLSSGFKFD